LPIVARAVKAIDRNVLSAHFQVSALLPDEVRRVERMERIHRVDRQIGLDSGTSVPEG
jgi:hypothetical protein